MAARLMGATLALLFVSAVAVYGVFGADVWRWGCPSQAEITEPWSPDEAHWPPNERRLAGHRLVAS